MKETNTQWFCDTEHPYKGPVYRYDHDMRIPSIELPAYHRNSTELIQHIGVAGAGEDEYVLNLSSDLCYTKVSLGEWNYIDNRYFSPPKWSYISYNQLKEIRDSMDRAMAHMKAQRELWRQEGEKWGYDPKTWDDPCNNSYDSYMKKKEQDAIALWKSLGLEPPENREDLYDPGKIPHAFYKKNLNPDGTRIKSFKEEMLEILKPFVDWDKENRRRGLY